MVWNPQNESSNFRHFDRELAKSDVGLVVSHSTTRHHLRSGKTQFKLRLSSWRLERKVGLSEQAWVTWSCPMWRLFSSSLSMFELSTSLVYRSLSVVAHDSHVLAIKLKWPLYFVDVARLHVSYVFASQVCGRYTLFQQKYLWLQHAWSVARVNVWTIIHLISMLWYGKRIVYTLPCGITVMYSIWCKTFMSFVTKQGYKL